eukprot:1738028-Rhodomonas_salina.1
MLLPLSLLTCTDRLDSRFAASSTERAMFPPGFSFRNCGRKAGGAMAFRVRLFPIAVHIRHAMSGTDMD